MPKWYDVAEKHVNEGERILRTFPGKLDGEGGYIVITDKKLFFVREEGFLRKSYDLTLDLPYDEISKVSIADRYELVLTDDEDRKHEFTTSELPVANVERSIEEAAHKVYA